MKFDAEGFRTDAVLQAYRFVDATIDELRVDLASKKFATVKGETDKKSLPITIKVGITKEFAQQEDKATVEQAMIVFKRKIQGA